METTPRYWITVVSKDHLARGIAGGFMQANHGKPGPLQRIKAGDWVIFYSHKQTYKGNEQLQAFTGIGQATDDEYAIEITGVERVKQVVANANKV